MQTRSKGSKKPDYVFVVMPLLGKDLHKLQHEQITRRFSLSTSIFVAMQTLAAIEELHTCGFISRDIKPSNFAIGRYEDRQHRTIFLLDFGLAKRYLDIVTVSSFNTLRLM
uniref:Protein kinase domain-containing protein n=1 Tax=Parascaris univalens TaxID=6257 RepID=A0A915AQ48_PARUN